MPTETQLWKIQDGMPTSLPRQKLNFESKLESWIVGDIGLVNEGLLVIGQQISTDYGGIIDVLSMDSEGNLVILELKRDRTPRDIVAQTLDYASCIQNWGVEKITEIAESFWKEKTLAVAFKEKFQIEPPEVLNERHRIYIVASQLDSASERIVQYLSETHHVDINVVTFSFFKTEDVEFIARSFLLDETQVETRSKSQSKRKSALSWEELEGLAKNSNVLDLYRKAVKNFSELFDSTTRTLSNVSFIGRMGDNKSRNSIISIFPVASSPEVGLAAGVYIERLSDYTSIRQDHWRSILGEENSKVKDAVNNLVVSGRYWVPCYGLDESKINALIDGLEEAKNNAGKNLQQSSL